MEYFTGRRHEVRTETLILLVVIGAAAALAIIGLAVGVTTRKMRSQKLRDKFGPEYDYTIEKTGYRRSAEEKLQEREKRNTELEIRPLSAEDRERYNGEWLAIQSDFVDNPPNSVAEANRLIKDVMGRRGFPMEDFERRTEDLSVLYPDLVSNYRNAHDIAVKNERNETSTEDLRQAMVYYRSLFSELLNAVEVENSRS
jgi:hypothetical protein